MKKVAVVTGASAQSMLERMCHPDDAAFYDLSEPESKQIRIRTPTIFFPLALDSSTTP